jgi:hypothetical protein
MDTDRVEAKQLKCRLLQLGWFGVESEPVFAVERCTHGVLGQCSEVSHKFLEAHDTMAFGRPFDGLFGFDRV